MRFMVVVFVVTIFLIWDTGFNRSRYTGPVYSYVAGLFGR